MKLGSLFDGSGGFPLGGILAGITPVWASEIEPYPIRVTTKRLPYMRHYGDISGINGADVEPVDIITFGSPCQDMSVAGRRAGLGGERSGLFYQATRIIREMRGATNGRYPRWAVWENVPGAFSSNNGEDFRAVLEELISTARPDQGVAVPKPRKWEPAGLILGDGFSIAWRVLDAQYWGVPQRRKRIFLVADLTGERAGDVLFKSEGVSGYTPQGFRSREGTADTTAGSAGSAVVYENHSQDSRYKEMTDVCQAVTATYGTGGNNQPLVTYSLDRAFYNQGKNAMYKPQIDEEVSQTVVAKGPNAVATSAVYSIGAYNSAAMLSDNPTAGVYKADTSRTIDANGGSPACDQGGMVVLQGSMIGREEKNGPQGSGVNEDGVSYTLNTVDKHAVAYQTTSYIVRRLTPTECARLQGFPDDWCADLGTDDPSVEELAFWRGVFDTYTRIYGKKAKTDKQILKWLKDPHTDSAEYKMWGNGVALPCVYFVLSGIVWAHRESRCKNDQC